MKNYTTTYRALTSDQRKKLPGTFGATPHANSVYISDSKNDDPTISMLQTSFNIGLENYIDSASWRICDILRASNNANKEAQVFQLAFNANGHTQKEALKAWYALDKGEQLETKKLCQGYLEHCLGYLQEEF